VRSLQAFLLEQGFLTTESHVTGFFGPHTESALRNFQISRQIPQTGRADIVSRAAIMIATCGRTPYDIPSYVPLFRGLFGSVQGSVRAEHTWTAIVNNEFSTHFAVSVAWGDGTASDSQRIDAIGSHALPFTHAYASRGTYDAVFTVTNPAGKKNTSTITIRIEE
jgi:peptidoglycan hydrolase-like protein with peptidoglycan-binding domain